MPQHTFAYFAVQPQLAAVPRRKLCRGKRRVVVFAFRQSVRFVVHKHTAPVRVGKHTVHNALHGHGHIAVAQLFSELRVGGKSLRGKHGVEALLAQYLSRPQKAAHKSAFPEQLDLVKPHKRSVLG